MNRRAFIQSLFGIAAGSAISAKLAAAIDALEPIVEVPAAGEIPYAGYLRESYSLSFFFKKLDGSAPASCTHVTEYANGWHRIHIPIRADSDKEANERAMAAIKDLSVDAYYAQLELLRPEPIFIATTNWRMDNETLVELTK